MEVDRRAVAAGRRLDQITAGGVSGSADGGDPYGVAWKAQLAPPQPGWEFGVIYDVLPGGYAYRVSAGQRSFLWCSPAGTTGGFGVTGGRPLTTYVVGTPVWFVRHPETPATGTIMGAEPHHCSHTANQPADSIWPFIRSGQRAEASHQFPLVASEALGAAGEVPFGNADGADFSAGRPVDGTAAGEWGVQMETGVTVFADPYQAYIRVDESTGLFVFYADQVLRLAAQNYQQYTSLSELEQLEDEGELLGVKRKTVYPWENHGLDRWNQVTAGWQTSFVTNHGLPAGQGLALNDPLVVQAGAGVATSEPEYPSQISAARGLEFDGYLGQGGTSHLSAPVQLAWAYPSLPANARTAAAGFTANPVAGFAPSGRLTVNGDEGPGPQPYAVPPNTRLAGRDRPGVFEEHKTLAGGWHVRSATRIILAKRAAIPTPRPLRRPEDPYGDSPTTGPADYHPSGLNNGAAVHAVASGLTPASGAPQRAAGLFDVLSYAFNWENVHPFAYHARDWYLAQEGAAGSTLVNTRVPNYALLAAAQYLAAPAPATLDIDHRYGLVPVYENESSVCLLEDGTVVITDGWGSEIRMHSGDISLRCAGDISLFPGRNLITWAGHDIAMKAHDSVDLTAANGDLRTKANKNSHHLAGNSGCGGFLFEAKAVCPVYAFAGRVGESVISSGFTVLAPTSEVLVLAQDVAIKLEDTSEAEGKITLDAGEDRHIRTFSNTLVSRFSSKGARVDLFDGTSAGSSSILATANEFTASQTYLGNDLAVYGKGFFWDDVTTAGWLIAKQTVAGETAAAFDNKVVNYPANSAIANAADAVEDRYDYLIDTYKPAVEDEVDYPAGGDYAEYTSRTTSQYRTGGFEFWESRWHTMARDTGQILPLWSEPAVYGLRSGVLTLPHPGLRWIDSSGYRGQDPGYTDYTAGWVAIDRNVNRAAYESGVFPASRPPLSLSSVFAVTVPAG